jgi:hypothetical protein
MGQPPFLVYFSSSIKNRIADFKGEISFFTIQRICAASTSK